MSNFDRSPRDISTPEIPIMEDKDVSPIYVPFNQHERTDTIRETIREMVQYETKKLYKNVDAFEEELAEEGINFDDDVDLIGMDKIPDVVKGLRVFSGAAGEYGSWKKGVERILNIYEHLKGRPKYYGILNVVRNKITGDADMALESYNTPLNLRSIVKCLDLHYADKRDIGTLEFHMTTKEQKNLTIEDFYKKIYQHFSLILEKLSAMELSPDSLMTMTQF